MGVSQDPRAPDGTWLATASLDRTVRIWDAATGQQRAFTGHTKEVTAVVIAPDGTWLASSDNPSVRIWDASTGRQLAVLTTDRIEWIKGWRSLRTAPGSPPSPPTTGRCVSGIRIPAVLALS